MNAYKIDVNSYVSGTHQYALYVKRAWWRRWEHVESFKTPEDAKEHYERLAQMPIYLNGHAA